MGARFTVALTLTWSLCCGGEAMKIAENGTAKATVVVAKQATQPEKHAAAELAAFLEQITGASFQVAEQADGLRLFVGPDAARRADPKLSLDGLGADGVIIRSVGDGLILAGGRPRGTLYAVYTFLEDQVGCRWWSSKVSTIPKKPTLTIAPLAVRYVPPLEYREPFWTDAFDGDWAVRNKANGNSERLDARRGGKISYQGFVHTFYALIPPATYFEAHPEWFSELKGTRAHKGAQLCLTNEAMREELVTNLKANLRKNPAATIASVSQNDWHGACQCAKCAAIDAEEGSHAGTLLRFVNAVAADIEKEFPHVAISTLAYQYTRKPPLKVTPRPNVIVRLCSIECSFSTPLSDPRNAKFGDDIRGWSKVCKRLYVWDYVTNFRHHIMPHPNLRVLGPNVKFFVKHHVKGLFEQGAYTTLGAEMAELRAWVLAKLLWNPKLDAQELIDEFLAGYYGPAAPHVAAHLKVMHDAVEAAGDKLGCFSSHKARFLSFDTLHTGWQHLAAAEKAVEKDDALRFRVQVAQLPILYTLMVRWNEMRRAATAAKAPWPVSDDPAEVLAHFKAIANAKGMTRLNEWQQGFGALDKAVASLKPVQVRIPGFKAATASSGADAVKLAFDADPATCWNSGGHAPAWIRFDFDKPRVIKELSATVNQQPDGPTEHAVTAFFADGSSRVVHTFKGATKSGQALEAAFTPPLQKVTALRIDTRRSPSWVAWSELSVK